MKETTRTCHCAEFENWHLRTAHTYCTRRFLAHSLSRTVHRNLHNHRNGPQAPLLTSLCSESYRLYFDVDTMAIDPTLPSPFRGLFQVTTHSQKWPHSHP